MASSLKPGDVVVCMKTAKGYSHFLHVGQLYTILDYGQPPHTDLVIVEGSSEPLFQERFELVDLASLHPLIRAIYST
jgi:hypothetical protein